jgi:guanosine-3',5'-bis(diphosphate) 3'-pyrophosphohydrolase
MLPLVYLWELIDSHATESEFMHAVADTFGPHSSAHMMITMAYDIMVRGHRGDKRHSGEQYIKHTLAVAIIVMLHLRVHDYQVVIAALLHDVVEDHPERYGLGSIESVFGPRVARIVASVTKPPYEEYGGKTLAHARATARQVMDAGWESVVVKLADRLNNLMSLWGSRRKKCAKLVETFRHFLPIAFKYRVLVVELSIALVWQLCSPRLYAEGSSEIGRRCKEQHC